MKKPDNIVFNYKSEEYDAFKKEYPTSFSSKNFTPDKLRNVKLDAQPYFQKKFFELKEQYDRLSNELKWNEIIYNSNYKFKPIIGKPYYLYAGKDDNFLSLISPKEWKFKCIGKFRLKSNNIWEKIE